jgi:beta-N-acetylhexosaminidase
VTGASRFVVGLEGPSLSAAERAAHSRDLPFGFLLLPRNFHSPVQAAELTAELRALGTPEPLLFVDQEGGAVDRLGPLLGQPFASAADVAAAGSDRVHENAFLMGRACRLLGFDADFAPCVDLGLRIPGEVVLAGRTFGFHAEEVVVAGIVFLHGLARAGIGSCVKHFPGLGRALADTHDELPVVDADEVDLMVTDVAPFARLASIADGVMVAHAAYPGLSGQVVPASLSPQIYALLRGPVGFGQAVFSDDLNMAALPGPLSERAARAAAAGCDVLVVSNPGDAWEESIRRVAQTEVQDQVARGREQRLRTFRDRCSAAPRPAFTSVAWDDLSAAVAAFDELLARPREIRAS